MDATKAANMSATVVSTDFIPSITATESQFCQIDYYQQALHGSN